MPLPLQWDGDSGPRPGNGSDIRLSDTTFTQHIRPFAAKLAAEPASAVPGCTARAPPAAPLSVLAAMSTPPTAVPAAEARTQAVRAPPSPSPSSPSPTSPSLKSRSPSPPKAPPSVKLFEGPPAGSGRKLLRG